MLTPMKLAPLVRPAVALGAALALSIPAHAMAPATAAEPGPVTGDPVALTSADFRFATGPVVANMKTGTATVGDVVYTFPKKVPLYYGSEFTDTVIGTGKDDVIYGFGGDDVIKAGGGHDLVRGGLGDDRIGGATGDDVIKGGKGDDLLKGRAGADRLHGNSGADSLRGGDGPTGARDHCKGGAGHDSARGCESRSGI